MLGVSDADREQHLEAKMKSLRAENAQHTSEI